MNWYKYIKSSIQDLLPHEDEQLGFSDIYPKLTEENLQYLESRYDLSEFKAGGEGATFIDRKTGHIVKITEQPEEYANAEKIMSGNGSEFFVPVYDIMILPQSGVYVIEEGHVVLLEGDEYLYIRAIHNDMVSENFSERIFSPYYKQDLADQMKYSTRFSFNEKAFDRLFNQFINLIRGISQSGFKVDDTHEDNVGWHEGRLVRFDFGYM